MSILPSSYGGIPNTETGSLKNALDFFAPRAMDMNLVCQLGILVQDLENIREVEATF